MLTTEDNPLKKVTFKNDCISSRWAPVDPITKGATIFVDIDKLYFASVIAYVKQDINPIVYINNFFSKKYLKDIGDYVKSILIDLDNDYNVMLLHKAPGFIYIVQQLPIDFSIFDLYDHTTNEIPSIIDLDVFKNESYELMIKNINTFIIKKSRFYKSIKWELSSFAISRDLDPSAFVYTTDLEFLVFSCRDIFKKENGQWYTKNREDLKKIFKCDEESLALTCVLVGTEHARAFKSTTKRSIINDRHKKDSVIKMLANRDKHDFLDFVLHSVAQGF